MKTGKPRSISLLLALGRVRYDITNPVREHNRPNFDIPLTATKYDSA
jgi:hypothetical protein